MRAWIAFAFGFIHGFGFANVLREMDLPARALGWSLFSFNVGVEIGQLLVVVAVASALAALRSRSEAAGRQLAFAGSIVVIAAGAFWFVQRVFFPGGILHEIDSADSVLSEMLLAIGALAAVKAQPPAANAPKVVEVEKVKDNLFVLQGGGGNTAVFVTANGVTVVDAKNPGWGQPILDKIKELTPKPVTTLINTHTHGDHVSGNVEFPATVDVVVQENTQDQHGEDGRSSSRTTTARDGQADLQGQDDDRQGRRPDRPVLLRPRPHERRRAGSSSRRCASSHAGDMFAGKALPLVDGDNGGSVLHYAETLTKAHDGDQERRHDHQRPHADADDMGGPEGVRGLQPGLPARGRRRTEGRQDAGAAGRRGVEGSRKVQRLSQRGRESPDAAREPAAVRRARRSDQEAAGRDAEVGETGRGLGD